VIHTAPISDLLGTVLWFSNTLSELFPISSLGRSLRDRGNAYDHTDMKLGWLVVLDTCPEGIIHGRIHRADQG
jgi:hypothetical protein